MKLFLLIAIFILNGCGNFSRSKAYVFGNSSECVEGVSYLQFPSGVTVQYGRDGKIKGCD